MKRLLFPLVLMSALAGCGPAADTPDAKAAAETTKADPEAEKAVAEKQKQAEQKAAFEAAGGDEAKIDQLADAGNGFALYHRGKKRIDSPEFTFQQAGFEDLEAAAEKQQQGEQKAAFEAAGGDEAKIDDLADAGNGFALYHRGKKRIDSQDYTFQQGGFEDLEAAAKAGNADAQLWVGEKMAYGLMGYQLKPNSGLMMMEKAAKQDNVDAILAVGLMYEQDTFMRDLAKAKTWYERGAALGSDKAKEALAKLGTPQDF